MHSVAGLVLNRTVIFNTRFTLHTGDERYGQRDMIHRVSTCLQHSIASAREGV